MTSASAGCRHKAHLQRCHLCRAVLRHPQRDELAAAWPQACTGRGNVSQRRLSCSFLSVRFDFRLLKHASSLGSAPCIQ